jgi:hypothetical protein
MKKSNTLFNERRENIFKENIPAFSVQEKSRSVSVLLKNLVTIIQNMFIGIMKIHIWSYLYKHVTNPEKKGFKENNFFL